MKNFFEINTSEHDEQVSFVRWFRLKYPGVVIIAIPNGGKRHISAAKKLKDEGVVSGVPDLFIPSWKVWIEMKKKGGRVSDAQNEMMRYLRESGYLTFVCYGAKEAQMICEDICK